MSGKSGERVICPRCDEGVNFGHFRRSFAWSMENRFASPVPVPTFATGSRSRRKIDHTLVLHFYAPVFHAPLLDVSRPDAVLFAPPVPKHPEHKADG
jgi:hypothetical protein